jgi:hypothetical protein
MKGWNGKSSKAILLGYCLPAEIGKNLSKTSLARGTAKNRVRISGLYGGPWGATTHVEI